LRASFPSASVFKVVTAAAAISEEKLSADTVIPVNGRYHTLYRSQVLKDKVTPWTRYVTLRDAFARSVNSAFGKLGVRSVGAEKLREYAERFGFNQIITSDVPIEIGRALISDDPWDVAEAASGYTRDNTMSPLHGALIAAAVANDGMMMEPFVVQSAHKEDGSTVYSATPREIKRVVDPSAAAEIRELMRQTVASGTSRSSFRGFFKGQFSDLNVGGKTGSLTGMDPPGKYDWFVGFAEGGNTRLAVAAMTVHKKYWRVKSSYLARRAIERYFRDHAGDSAIPASVAAPVRNVKNNP
jgi:cell division protein FtsI/penicillin-binding protein 2